MGSSPEALSKGEAIRYYIFLYFAEPKSLLALLLLRQYTYLNGMARSKKPRKSNLTRNLLTYGGVLALIQVGLILYFSEGTEPTEIKDAIEQSLSKQAGLNSKAKEQLKIQLAVNHFQTDKGKLPDSLSELVPVYFDSIPIDPDTSKPFAYQVANGRFYIGDRTQLSDSKLAKNNKATDLSSENRSQLEQEALIASLDENLSLVSFIYDPSGKRDPFRPYDATPVLTIKGQGLQGYDIGQLRLTAVVDNSIVTIEDQSGKGFIARKGDKIGLNNGEIVEIQEDKIKILETSTDFTGKEVNKVLEMVLRSGKPKT